jgi:hypothetical protein
MNLPPKLRNRIYYFALVATEDPLVPRSTLAPRPGLRFRYNRHPNFWKAIVLGRANADWFNIVNMKYHAKSINARHYAFGLFFASRSTCNEATSVFYSGHHFVFEDRFNLHMFIMAIGKENTRHVLSVSVDLRKSTGVHSDKIKNEHAQWQLHLNKIHGPTLAESIIELRNACPQLEYLEVQLYGAVYHPSLDYKQVDRHYSEWGIVKALCTLSVQRFSFITLKDSTHNYPEIEMYINKQIRP